MEEIRTLAILIGLVLHCIVLCNSTRDTLRTRWQLRTEPPHQPNPIPNSELSSTNLSPLFPPIRSTRGREKVSSSTAIKFTDDIEAVNIDVTNADIGSDETDELVERDIAYLNETLSLMLSPHRRPTVSPDGTIHFLPTPNFSFLPDIGALRQLFQWSSTSISSYAVCHACRVGLGYLLLQAHSKKAIYDDISSQAIYICKLFNIANDEICVGLVNRFGPTMHYILMSQASISATMFCGMVLQPHGCKISSYLPDWTIELPPLYNAKFSALNLNGEDNLENKANKIVFEENAQAPSSANKRQTVKILHLTDIHMDPEYRPGGNAKCDKELCCRTGDGDGPLDGVAGFYGDYRKCDLPKHSVEDALDHIARQHPDIELIYLTGDMVPHNVWSTTANGNIQIIADTTRLIRTYFPNTRVFPVLGNHDVHPANMFSPPGVPLEYSTAYIYSAALKEWTGWIPQDSIHNFLHGGFYSVQVTPELKVIVLNTNVCYHLNFWQVYNNQDPSGQLQWLTRELGQAELIGSKVHILGHVPPSLNECWSMWSRNFYKIIRRFQNTVKGQFYGHTHYDEFHVQHENNERSGKAFGVAWIGPSLTPFVNLNPGYQIFHADGAKGQDSLWEILDHETWIYDLQEANANPLLRPRWFKFYRSTEAYRLQNTLPESLSELVYRMSSNNDVFESYHRYYFKGSTVSLEDECDKTCRKRILCRIVTPYSTEQRFCQKIQVAIDGIVLPTRSLTKIQNSTLREHF